MGSHPRLVWVLLNSWFRLCRCDLSFYFVESLIVLEQHFQEFVSPVQFISNLPQLASAELSSGRKICEAGKKVKVTIGNIKTHSFTQAHFYSNRFVYILFNSPWFSTLTVILDQKFSDVQFFSITELLNACCVALTRKNRLKLNLGSEV